MSDTSVHRFTLIPTAHLRCPEFADDPDAQRFWNGLWNARLRIFGRLFPWVGQAIKVMSGMPPNATIGGENHQHNVAYLAAHDEYAKGYRSARAEVRAIHDRQNDEWQVLTNLPPLGSIEDWRAAAAAAGIPPAEFDQANMERVADLVLAWALAKRAMVPSNPQPPAIPELPRPADKPHDLASSARDLVFIHLFLEHA